MHTVNHAIPFKIANIWPSPWLWISLGFIGATDLIWIEVTQLQFDPAGLSAPLFAALLLFLLSISGWRKLPSRMVLFMMGTTFVLCAWPILRIFNHLVMTVPLPLTDNLLAEWDTGLGLDWKRYVFWVDGHPWLVRAMTLAYLGLTVFSCCAFAVLISVAEKREAHEFLVLFFLSAVIASAVGAFFPAYTAMYHYSPVQQLLKNISPNYGVSFASYLDDIRANPKHLLQFSSLPGLTAFPSFHTAMALITIFCSRSRMALFVPSLLFNGLTIAAAPVLGGHYFVDILAGGALVCLLVFFRRCADAKSEGGYPRHRSGCIAVEDRRPRRLPEKAQ